MPSFSDLIQSNSRLPWIELMIVHGYNGHLKLAHGIGSCPTTNDFPKGQIYVVMNVKLDHFLNYLLSPPVFHMKPAPATSVECFERLSEVTQEDPLKVLKCHLDNAVFKE